MMKGLHPFDPRHAAFYEKENRVVYDQKRWLRLAFDVDPVAHHG